MTAAVERVVFSTPRAAEFLELRALQAQTGQPVSAFGAVVLKELLDNALDAAETAGIDPVITVGAELDGDCVRVSLSDNGSGIAADTVTRICDFTATVSDKARYRGPTRGAQGNALKTLLGIPFALGLDAPVVIESAGVRHELKVVVDPLGDVVVSHDQTAVEHRPGTTVSVPLPLHVHVDAGSWAYKAALVNPHAAITVIDRANDAVADDPEIYKPAGGRWAKWLPSMPSSPHWYTPEAFSALVHSHIRETARTGVDAPIGRFISEFDGLSGSAKQKQIRAAAAGVTHLSGLAGRDDLIRRLYESMVAAAKPSAPGRLGAVGKEHLEQMLDREFGVRRFWYRQAALTHAGIPWVIEVAVADTEHPGGVWFGCNHSPSFADPLGKTSLHTDGIHTTGSASFLSTAGITRAAGAAVVHVICAASEFTDKGKVALVVPETVAQAAADALAGATKVIRREQEQRRKDATRAARAQRRARENAQRAERTRRVTLKDAVFDVLPTAKARAGDVVSARTLFYKVRPLVQEHTDQELGFGYFSQTLLPEYERTVAPIPGLYYEPRGELHHPHDGTVTALGTREVETYRLPPWQFDKILYIEKTGLQAQLAPYEFGRRYDMAIIYGQGYAVTACRNLLASSAVRDLPIFVLHDADIDGYNIARTLSVATKRMPDHNIEVIDLGLTAAQAIEYGLETEKFTRKRDLPADLELDADAADWFTGRPVSAGHGKTHYEATRCELNAFSSDGLAQFIEDGLRRHDANTKLTPPPPVIADRAHRERHALMVEFVKGALHKMVNVAALATVLAAEVDITGIDAAALDECFEESPRSSWSDAVGGLVDVAVRDSGITAERVAALVAEQLEARR
ncbi:MAG: hypothetical protein QG671_1948 [Actinomycetota bacterium]|nr:hypothetical protein [Actinomycetota bacterium]